MGLRDDIRSWLRSPEDSAEQLATQLQHAEALSESCKASVEAAQAAFYADPSDANLKALKKHRAALEDAEEHVDRAETLLADARKREEAEKAAAKRKEMNKKAESLSPEAIEREDAPLAEREAKLLAEVARVRVERLALHDAARERANRVQELARELSIEPPPVTVGWTPHRAVMARLEALASKHGEFSDERGLLLAARPDGDAYSPGRHLPTHIHGRTA